MKKIVVFGAGNIGRSFIARVFAASGYEIVFADVSRLLVGQINRRASYTVIDKADGVPDRKIEVAPVRAIAADDPEAVSQALSSGNPIAATAVGDRAFDTVIRAIAAAVRKRSTPIDIILAENIHGAAGRARNVLLDAGYSAKWIDRAIGLVETSIGKMVPIMPREVREEDPLLCWAEAYNTLIVDGAAFRLPVPEVQDLYPVSPIAPWVDRKLYIHNMGHAAAAYLGFLNNPKADYIWEVLDNAAVFKQVREAMSCSAEALASAYPASFSRRELLDHVDDLVARFRNRALGDTVYRVGRDLLRKLSRDDRIVGAIEMALRQGIDPAPIVQVFHAAPHFAKPGPEGTLLPSDAEFAHQFAQQGEEWLLHEVVGIGSDETVLRSVLTRGADRRELRR